MFRDTNTVESMKPFVSRALNDDQIHKNVTRAWQAARKVYDELSGEDAVKVAKKVSNKDSIRDDLDTAVQNLSEAMVRMSGNRTGRRGGWGTFVLLLAVGLALFNPATGASTRKWLKDHLFGSEEEFDYDTPQY